MGGLASGVSDSVEMTPITSTHSSVVKNSLFMDDLGLAPTHPSKEDAGPHFDICDNDDPILLNDRVRGEVENNSDAVKESTSIHEIV